LKDCKNDTYAEIMSGLKKFLLKLIYIFAFIAALYLLVRWLYPIHHENIIRKYTREYGLREELIYGIIRTESGFDIDAESNRGAGGLMQIVKMTADWGAEEIGLDTYDYSQIFQPEINIRIGCWYLSKLIKQYGNEETALAAYNAGSGRVSQWLSDSRYSQDGITLTEIPFKETRRYVNKVKNNEKIYKILLDLFNRGSK
jgi:soluble lytic murein transglycosylase